MGATNGHSLTYPWGNKFDIKRCNTRESKIGTTTPIGTYSMAGASPCGAEEMAGNVWDWTASPYHSSNGKRMVLRGGSWYYDHQYARPAAFTAIRSATASSSAFGSLWHRCRLAHRDVTGRM